MVGAIIMVPAILALLYVLTPFDWFVALSVIIAFAACFPGVVACLPNLDALVDRYQGRLLVLLAFKDINHGLITGIVTIFVIPRLGSMYDIAMLQLLTGTFFGIALFARSYALTSIVTLTIIFVATLYAKGFVSEDSLPFFWVIATGAYVGCVLMILRLQSEDIRNRIASYERDELLETANAAHEQLTVYSEELASRNEELDKLAWFDPLTGLANRRAFQRYLDRYEAAAEDRRQVLFMLIDVDNFKWVNDRFGHTAGDEVLITIAERLRSVTSDNDFLARLGGDEFVVIADRPGITAESRLPEEIADILQKPARISGRKQAISASLGCVWGILREHTMTSADLALMEAKGGTGGKAVRFEQYMLDDLVEDSLLQSELAIALTREELTLHFQPQVCLRSGNTIGYEGLLRWHNPRRGAVAPPKIVAAAQRAGLGYELLRHVVRCAARFRTMLYAAGHDDIRVGFNLSPRDLSAFPVSNLIAEVLAQEGLKGSDFEVEVTEEIFLDIDAVETELKNLAEMGIRLAVDDFGAGFSSMTSLRRFSFQCLKIDRAFADKIDSDRRAHSVFSAMVGIGVALDMDVIAEGIETAAQLEVARAVGAAQAQGYYIARPMPAADAIAFLTRGAAEQKICANSVTR
ncbi:putative bifunctional diguanylate cyclase/phosphodiesterase [Pelagibacterium halotolerans]|uniref:putative bifunctional diguanylate cyclase/phosphodiesterase n=1 Tax=Pelagibacterium halotolerans TaxID=531813 RepID=UPI00384D21C3